jgi:hypothetical protein
MKKSDEKKWISPADVAAAFQKTRKVLLEELDDAEAQLIQDDQMIIEMRNEIIEYRRWLKDIAEGIKSGWPALSNSVTGLLNKYPQAKAGHDNG